MVEQAEVTVQKRGAVARDLAGKYLTFTLNTEEFGISIGIVKEIIKLMSITHIPQTPDYIKGVINLRERVIPVTDLRMKFGMPAGQYTTETCIIVLDLQPSSAGAIVDAVSEVVDIKSSEIEPPPAFDGRAEVANIQGMAKVKGRVVILLDIIKSLNSEGVTAVKE